jgi:phage repressor protein C with HTH and peptisase S24 domain
MKVKALHENLRKAIAARIAAKELTGLKLAHQTGFKQAHISNFLNRKRWLSLEGMDKMLSVQDLSILDLLDPAEVNKRASIPAPSDDQFENVLLVEKSIAAREPLIMRENVRDILKFKKSFLKRLRVEMVSDRAQWHRFVLIKVDAREGMSMYPRLMPGATALIDRHYNSLKPYHKGGPNMYAVRKDGACTVKYVESAGNTLVLRPHNQAHPVDVLTLSAGSTAADYIVGRICHVGVET